MAFPTHKSYADLLLRLPRELRDLVYPHLVTEDHPIHLDSIDPDAFTGPLQINPTIATETLEAYYKYNTFTATLDLPELTQPNWGPHPSIAKSHISSLIVLATESSTIPETSAKTYEDNHRNGPDRQRWKHLYSLPKLQNLTIKMQKYHDSVFSWQDFTPILMSISSSSSTNKPRLSLTFHITFDSILETEWNSAFWGGLPAVNPVAVDYRAMGYINVTHLFVAANGPVSGPDGEEGEGGEARFGIPTEEDRQYVSEWLPDRVMPKGRSITAGLLDKRVSERRSLGEHYVVKEAQLLRVLMEEQFKAHRVIAEEK